MPTADQLVAVLEGWLREGIKEVPDGSNKTPIGAEFGWNGVAWCAETCSVALKRIGQRGFWTASVYQAIQDAKAGKNGLKRLGKNDAIRVGDFVTYDWKGNGNPENFHIATVVATTNTGSGAKFETIGGNEENRVMRQWRDRTFVSGFIRPAYDNAPAPVPPTPPTPTPVHEEDDDMPKTILVRSDINPDVYLTDCATFARKVEGEGSVKEAGYPSAFGKVVIVEEDEMAKIKTLPRPKNA